MIIQKNNQKIQNNIIYNLLMVTIMIRHKK